jgi:lipopolysaccharide biosynthesis glycosyltransferase
MIGEKRNLLVTLADKNYIQQAKQLFSSAYWNAGWKGDYMLLAHEIPEKELKWFRNKGILVEKCRPIIKEGFGRWPVSVLSKLYLFSSEMKKWKNIVFLDADMIVKYSLDNLTQVQGFNAWKGSEFEGRFNFENETRKKELAKKYNLRWKAFSGAVFAFSTDIIKDYTLKHLKFIANKYQDRIKNDEAILGIYFYKKYHPLPEVYNVCLNYLAPLKNQRKVKGIVLHFIGTGGGEKPWNSQNPFHEEWKANLEKAELIDLKKRVLNPKRLSQREIYRMSSRIKFLKLAWKVREAKERFLGRIGKFIRKRNENFYCNLKKMKKT